MDRIVHHLCLPVCLKPPDPPSIILPRRSGQIFSPPAGANIMLRGFGGSARKCCTILSINRWQGFDAQLFASQPPSSSPAFKTRAGVASGCSWRQARTSRRAGASVSARVEQGFSPMAIMALRLRQSGLALVLVSRSVSATERPLLQGLRSASLRLCV